MVILRKKFQPWWFSQKNLLNHFSTVTDFPTFFFLLVDFLKYFSSINVLFLTIMKSENSGNCLFRMKLLPAVLLGAEVCDLLEVFIQNNSNISNKSVIFYPENWVFPKRRVKWKFLSKAKRWKHNSVGKIQKPDPYMYQFVSNFIVVW